MIILEEMVKSVFELSLDVNVNDLGHDVRTACTWPVGLV